MVGQAAAAQGTPSNVLRKVSKKIVFAWLAPKCLCMPSYYQYLSLEKLKLYYLERGSHTFAHVV